MTVRRMCATCVVLGALFVAADGCAHVADLTQPAPTVGPSVSSAPTLPGASPTPSGTPTPPSTSPSGTCTNTQRDGAATIIVSIDPDFAATSSTYGSLFGYAVYDPSGTTAIPSAAAIVAARTTDAIQFANYDPGTVTHSAVGFGNVSAFPSVPFSFSPSAAGAESASITTGTWSTGLLSSFGNTSSTVCYSQTFSVPSAGTYFFGDDPLYNSASSFRGVLVVSP